MLRLRMSQRPVRHVLFAIVAALLLGTYPQPARSQAEPGSNRKQVMASGGAWQNVFLTAASIERGVSYPSTIELKGGVEIKMKGVLVQADEATFHEGNGEIEARGTVRVRPYPAMDAAREAGN